MHATLQRICLGVTLIAVVALRPGICSAQVAGVDIDTSGVLRIAYSRRESASLAEKRMQTFAQDNLPAEVAPFVEMRKISLRQLEHSLKEAGSIEALPQEVQLLFGLQRMDYIFVDDADGDIVLAGPAEGFAPDASGRMIGLTTGRPPLHLDDLLVALRWANRSRGRGQIGCSIDPDPQRLQDLQNWLRENSTPATRDVARSRYDVMARILGLQNVSVFEIPDDSHFAQVLVEADYRMKLIALGKENPGVRGLRSHLSMLAPLGNSLQRWWFVPLYDPIEADEQGLAFHLSGQRAQLMAQDEWSDPQGRRSDASFTRATAEKFAEQFTDHFPELAERSPVFAELQNVFDLAVLAALIEREDVRRRTAWPMSTLLDEEQFPVSTFRVPKFVESSATTTSRARSILGLVGGVTLTPGQVVGQRSRHEGHGSLTAVRQSAISRTTSAEQPSLFWDE